MPTSERTPKVVIIGGAYVDMVVRCGQVPSPGQSTSGTALSYTATGPGPNQAAEAALCGCRVHLISRVGGDPFAQMVKSSLAEFGVNTDFVISSPAKNTGVVVTLVNAEGENASLVYAGANCAMQPQDIDAADNVMSEADVCLIHGELPQAVVATAIKRARAHGAKVILNPARPMERPAGGSTDLPAEYFTANILIPNLYEAADIIDEVTTPSSRRETAKLIGSDIVARGADAAVITMGKRGCLVVDRAGADHVPAFEVELVDQTGRGDAFAGALAASCAVGDNIREAVKFASAAGALACTKFGSIEALPSKAEIIELLQKHDIE